MTSKLRSAAIWTTGLAVTAGIGVMAVGTQSGAATSQQRSLSSLQAQLRDLQRQQQQLDGEVAVRLTALGSTSVTSSDPTSSQTNVSVTSGGGNQSKRNVGTDPSTEVPSATPTTSPTTTTVPVTPATAPPSTTPTTSPVHGGEGWGDQGHGHGGDDE